MGRKAARVVEPDWPVTFANAMASLNVLRPWAPLTESETEIYARQCAKVPLVLLEAASVRWLKDNNRFPTPHQLLELCETIRLEKFAALRATLPPCGHCSEDGWVTTVVDGYSRATRCACWTAFQQARVQLGLPNEPLALPAPEVEG